MYCGTTVPGLFAPGLVNNYIFALCMTYSLSTLFFLGVPMYLNYSNSIPNKS